MATDEEIFKIIVQTQGQAEVEKLTAVVRKQEDAIRLLTAELRLGAITQAQFDAGAKKAASTIADANQKIGAFQKSSRDLGRAALEASRGFEDLQYGVAGVLNNIPSLVQALGGGAGLAGALSFAAVAGKILYDNWDNLAGALGGGHVKTAAEEMEELRKKTELTANEAERLARADALTSKVKELRGAATDAQKAEEEAATKAIVEHGGVGGLATEIRRRDPGMVDRQGDAAGVMGKIGEQERLRASALQTAAATRGTPAEAFARQQARDAQTEIDRLRRDELEPARARTAEQIAATAAIPTALGGNRERIAAMMAGTPLGRALSAADPAAVALREDDAAREGENAAGTNAMLQSRENWMKEQTARFAGNASRDARAVALQGVAGSGSADRGAVGDIVRDDLANAGVDPSDLDEMATRVAEALSDAIEKKAKEDAAKGNMSVGRAARADLAQLDVDVEKERAAAMQTALASLKKVEEGRVMGSDEFARNLLTIKGTGERDLLQKQIDLQQRIVAASENTVQALRFGVPARLGGGGR